METLLLLHLNNEINFFDFLKPARPCMLKEKLKKLKKTQIVGR